MISTINMPWNNRKRYILNQTLLVVNTKFRINSVANSRHENEALDILFLIKLLPITGQFGGYPTSKYCLRKIFLMKKNTSIRKYCKKY